MDCVLTGSVSDSDAVELLGGGKDPARPILLNKELEADR